MKRKRPPRRATASAAEAGGEAAAPLQYKVVELSTVDEGALEAAVNGWVSQGWNLDGVQFAMRESSKRPAMAFVFFTRAGAPALEDTEAARQKLRDLAGLSSGASVTPISARDRLAQLAGEGDDT